MAKRKSRPLKAYWFKPSFHRTIYNDNDITFYIGVHSTRGKTKYLKSVQTDPRGFKPKIDISVYSVSGGESFPLYIEDIPRIMAGIDILNVMKNGKKYDMQKQVQLLINSWNVRPEISTDPYLIFDVNAITLKQIMEITKKIGYIDKMDTMDPIRRKEDISWLEGSHILMDRYMQDNDVLVNNDLVILGKDNKYNTIVLGLKKKLATGKEYTRVVPLRQDGLYFVASIYYVIYKKPVDITGRKQPLISESTLNRTIQEEMKKLRDFSMKQIFLGNEFDMFTKKMNIS